MSAECLFPRTHFLRGAILVIQQIVLQNFRNYQSLDIQLVPGVNVLMGANAQGKTNLLEAIGYCSTGRSHRTSYDRECIQIGESDAYIKLIYETSRNGANPRRDSIELHLRRNGAKSAAMNRVPVKKINDLYGNIHTVLFSPEDLSLIKEGPGRRRRFMDMEICQVDKVYLHYLQQYHILLRQRNQLLKEIIRKSGSQDLIRVYDEQFADYACRLIRRRQEFLKKLGDWAPVIHEQISGNTENIKFNYEANVAADPEQILSRLSSCFDQDLRQGTTTTGPHRDDIGITINDTDVRTYGSQGQKRTAALSMKLAEIEMMQEETGQSPVLLLDDVMSELDGARQRYLVQCIEKHQTVITCTGVEDSIRKMEQAHIFQVKEGRVYS